MLNRCRACLFVGDNMKFVTEDDPETKRLITMFTSINNFEWVRNNQMSSYLCARCETSLEISHEFRKKCLESYEIIMKEIMNEVPPSESLDETLESKDHNKSDYVDDEIIIYVDNKSDIVKSKDSSQDVQNPTNEQNTGSKCIVCLQILPTIQALYCHISQMHKDVKRHWCHLCNNVFYNLRNHREFSHNISGTPIYVSNISGQNPETNPSLTDSDNEVGELKTSGDKTTDFEDNMGADVVNEEQISNDLQTVSSQNKYCEKCDKNVRSLKIHMKKAHSNNAQPEKFTCYICLKDIKCSRSLRAHLKVHEGDTPYKCSYCGKPHKNKGHLVEHERTHTGEKPFICSICGKGFAQAGALRLHMKIHTGRPEVCKICDKRFCRPSELKLHLRRHSGEKPFLCTECGKAFIQKSHLMEHMKTHSDLRPFKCIYCDKAFKQKSLLTSHLRIHSGYKPYRCKLCEYACLKAYRLQQHMKLHDTVVKKNKEYICPVCQKGFSSQALLNGHVTSSHNAIL